VGSDDGFLVKFEGGACNWTALGGKHPGDLSPARQGSAETTAPRHLQGRSIIGSRAKAGLACRLLSNTQGRSVAMNGVTIGLATLLACAMIGCGAGELSDDSTAEDRDAQEFLTVEGDLCNSTQDCSRLIGGNNFLSHPYQCLPSRHEEFHVCRKAPGTKVSKKGGTCYHNDECLSRRCGHPIDMDRDYFIELFPPSVSAVVVAALEFAAEGKGLSAETQQKLDSIMRDYSFMKDGNCRTLASDSGNVSEASMLRMCFRDGAVVRHPAFRESCDAKYPCKDLGSEWEAFKEMFKFGWCE
jgi:hypothetical protein